MEDDGEWAIAGPKKKKGKGKKKPSMREDETRPRRQGADANAGQGAGASAGEEAPGAKSIEDMPKTEKSARGSGPPPPIPAALRALGPQLGRVIKTLKACCEELRRPPIQREGGRGLALADKAEDAMGVLEAFAAGMEAEKLRAALATVEASRGASHSGSKAAPAGRHSTPVCGPAVERRGGPDQRHFGAPATAF